MNKLILTFLLITAGIITQAQERFQEINHFKSFEVLLEAGYARPAGNGAKAGVLTALEPRLNLTDKITIGLRFETTAMARAGYQINNISADGEAGLGIAVIATGDYYFTNRMVRPYAGCGVGVYNFVSVEATSSNGGRITVPSVTKPGGMIRAGVEVWHLRAGFQYHIVGKTNTINNNYVGFTLGIALGGGVKEEYK
jgi:outer membrane protein W